MSKIYTKTGDQGETCIGDGQRLPKDAQIICALGAIDELNALLGWARRPSESSLMNQVQTDLFNIGACLSRAQVAADFDARMAARVTALEQQIDQWDQLLPALRSFIFSGGHEIAARLQVARAVCRRAERQVVAAGGRQSIIIYLNRLSDWLFILARLVNFEAKQPENIWTSE